MHDVVVVGAGPAGATAAALLAASGAAVLLLDRAHFPRDKPCSEYLNPEAAAVLQRSGALPSVDRLAPCLLRGMELHTPGGLHCFIDHSGGPLCGARAIERRLLDATLLEHAQAAGADVRTGFRVEQLLWRHGAVGGVIGSANGQQETYAARLVLACDGPHSVVARRLGLLRTARWPRRFGFVQHYAAVPGLRDVGEFHLARRFYVGIAPLGGGRANVTLIAPAEDVPRWRGRPEQYLRDSLVSLPGIWPRLAAGRPEGPLRVYGPLARVARRLSAPGVLLVGDAAGFFDPFTGEGLYRALRGAELAADAVLDALHQHDPARAAPTSYEAACHAAFQHKRLVAGLVQIVIQRSWLIDHVARRLAQRPTLARTLADVTADRRPARLALSPRFLAGLLL